MVEVAASLVTTLPPHIFGSDSVARRGWRQIVAALPVFVAAPLAGKAELLHVLLLSLVSAVAFEFLAAKIFFKKEKLRTGETVLIAVLFALLAPRACPAELIVLGNFFAIVAGREFFGGSGSYLFHPVLLARVFLQVSFPSAMTEPLVLDATGAWPIFGALILSGVIHLKQNQGYREVPFIFIAIAVVCAVAAGQYEGTVAFWNGVLLIAAFFFSDPVATPLTRRGTRWFAAGAAILSALLAPGGFSASAAAFSILLMNLLIPWLDLWIRPAGCRSREPKRGHSS
ncbi:MAG TPA: RnfABCDGE type electron transport complex subunit D [Candidatus Omnitrophota bacterium]|nr:RnfABCDGE type electron transport complex subunit D [Candidatus Omnitrophota bacterium]HPS36558.1 RnfABCDGE type electron transport complex subunit D [Candidatus Omnitrophota bacterium]